LLAELDPKREFKYHPKYEDRPEEKNCQRQDNYDLAVLWLDTGARYSDIANIYLGPYRPGTAVDSSVAAEGP
jgi:hypothetical protein